MVADTVPPRSRPRVRGCFAFSDAYFHGLGIAAAGQAAQSQPSSRLSKGSRRLFAPSDQQRRRSASAITKAAAVASSPRGGEGERVPGGKSRAVSFLKPGWGRWGIGPRASRRRGRFPGLRRGQEGYAGASLPPTPGTAASPPRTVPRAPWWRWSRLAPLHSQVTRKKKEEKVGEADARRKINRDKREEGGVADRSTV